MSDTNPAVTEAIESMMKPLSNPVLHGEFNRRMFLEAIFIKGGQGVSVTADDIIANAGMTEKEFTIIKNEYVGKGVIEENKNMFGVTMYCFKYEATS